MNQVDTRQKEDEEEEEEEKNLYEDEAEESDMDDFINDEPDEEGEKATAIMKNTINALRNRRKWKETEFECPLCADLRVVLRHLLQLN